MEENRKTKYRIKAWIQKHMIAVWAICSILFAIIIHLLFHWETDIEILHAKWSAGDILTYVSTVSLGLLAVWQNKRFKEENDIHYFSETSAKEGINAKEVFIEAAKLLYNEHLKYKSSITGKKDKITSNVPMPKKISLDGNKRKKGCCG